MSDPTSSPIALVTGASRGIGRAAAVALAANGWRVVATARSQKALEQLDDEIRAAGGEATLVPLDLKDFDGIDRLGGALYERYGRLDGLVSCAGVLGDLTPVAQARPAMMNEVIAVNLVANQRLIRSMDPLLRAAPAARAVFTTSGAARNRRAFCGPYAASKAGLEALVNAYALEVAITPIKVNLLDPGPVRTALRYKAFPGEDPTTLPTPEDVAPLYVEMLAPSYMKHGERVRYERANA
ncbi:MAG TPA: SDR family NAD(P)-dependent oxidoreductase [Caulobacterales bacterium]|jgi:NAD(P)-dependent dehydrogenase (short-subunit alcohol dehydrogenase family)|nr:SDR family NAD(P)-dependent oxidoreductase [Caulobacterales bacterium]